MTVPVTPSGTPPIPYGAIGFQADERTGKRLGGAFVRYHFSRPVRWISMTVVSVILLAVGFGLHQALQIALILAASFIAAAAIQYRGCVRTLGRLYPAGSLHWIQFGPATMVIAGPTAVTECRYSAFRSLWSSDSVVVLRAAHTRIFHVLPIELVPPMELDRLRALNARQQ